MAKKEEDKELADLKKVIKSENVIIGTETTIKSLKEGKIKKVFISSNCPVSVKKDIEYYSKINKSEFIPLKYSNEDLGVICKKPFSISVLGIKNE